MLTTLTRAIRPREKPYTLFARLSCWLVVAMGAPGWASSPLSMSFVGDAAAGHSVVIADLDAGAEIVYFSVSRFSTGFVPRTERRSEVLVDDGDGEIRVPLDRAPPPKFLAIAVDLSTGRVGVLTPPGSPARVVPLPVTSLVESPGQRLDKLEESKSYIEVLLVRSERLSRDSSSAGAWALTTGDGTASDGSPASDGLVRTAISDMEPVGMSPPPPLEFESGDLLVRVAPEDMGYYVARIER